MSERDSWDEFDDEEEGFEIPVEETPEVVESEGDPVLASERQPKPPVARTTPLGRPASGGSYVLDEAGNCVVARQPGEDEEGE